MFRQYLEKLYNSIKRMCQTKYRIVTDNFCGYEVQCKYWWFPFYMQWRVNTHLTIERAEEYINRCLHKHIYHYKPKSKEIINNDDLDNMLKRIIGKENKIG